MKFRTYYLPEKSAEELRADDHPFARVMLAARLALDAGDSVELREKYAAEIAETTAESEQKMFILDFARRILRLDDDKISEQWTAGFAKRKECTKCRRYRLRNTGNELDCKAQGKKA